MNLPNKLTPYLWHTMLAIAVSMLVLGPSAMADNVVVPNSGPAPVHPVPDPADGGGCEDDRDCDDIPDFDDLCPDYSNHALASEMGYCDALPWKGRRADGAYNWPYQTCSYVDKMKNEARTGSDVFGWIGIALFWIPILGAPAGGISTLSF
ncbi:MAG: hypothetical protein F4219_10155 [Gammaproteobacteria bacterium]|nr:hypothetical protein [Gammaproteobacteria bacterium]